MKLQRKFWVQKCWMPQCDTVTTNQNNHLIRLIFVVVIFWSRTLQRWIVLGCTCDQYLSRLCNVPTYLFIYFLVSCPFQTAAVSTVSCADIRTLLPKITLDNSTYPSMKICQTAKVTRKTCLEFYCYWHLLPNFINYNNKINKTKFLFIYDIL